MNWYFIRHGQIASNEKKIYSGRSNEPLTGFGRSQVRDGCKQLSDFSFDAIMCSPLTRTRQTAEIIVDSLPGKIPVHIEDCFNEIQMGPWEGMAEEDVSRQFPDEWALWNKSPANLAIDGRETLARLQARIVDGMQSIEHRYDYNSVLVVTHVAVIRVILLTRANRDLNQYKSIHVGNAEVFDIQNLSFA